MAQNLIEKIAQRFAIGVKNETKVKSGDYLSIQPAYVMTHDNTGAVIPKFRSIGATKMANPRQVVHTLDHNIQDRSEENLEKYRKIEDFSKTMGCDFYPAGRGIGHQIMIEEGYAFPGNMVVASDSHSNMYGGLGCLGTPIVRTDAAAIWATGRTWWQIPPVARVILDGKLKPYVTGKDIIITLAGFFNKDEVLNHAIEFSGDGITELSIDQRLTIANMTTEWGALAGVFPIDGRIIEWLENRTSYIKERGLSGVPSDADGNGQHPRINVEKIEQLKSAIPEADANAYYSKVIILNLDSIRPHVSGPNSVKVMKSVSEIENENIRIQKAYLVSCVNSRLDDIADAAQVVKGKKVSDGVEFYIAAASDEIQKESEKRGDWQILLSAGAIALPPGCGPCIGLGAGLLEDGEVGISATNRNFKGRMGSKNALTYLASPAVVAASAIAGKICSPFDFDDTKADGNIEIIETTNDITTETKILQGFPDTINGELIFCHQDNLNTDGIYPGKYTYQDDITSERQAEVVMENYDPEFVNITKNGNILVGGFNFGTGSSREQAATALKHKGLRLVIAGSFSETYKRNAINNGFLIIECPDLVNDLKSKFDTEKLTVKTGIQAQIDFKSSTITANDKLFKFPSVGLAAQELIISGGLEKWVKAKIG